ncbi:MAG: NPCBM/NEW2 domain-containing protein [Sedimentisphaerales bacterium]|nr:NPCBM/NEW2 domain-containing protein [Sedimentisphaerales bacterium]
MRCKRTNQATHLILLCIFSATLILNGCTTQEVVGAEKNIWLSSMDLSHVTAGWGHTKANISVDDKPMTLNGKVYDNGVGTHAKSLMVIALDGKALRFRATVGIDDGTAGRGSAQFKVYGDKQILFDSGIIKGGDKPQKIDIALAHVQRLFLLVDDAGDGTTYDCANWAEACIEYSGKEPMIMPVPQEERVILTPPPGPAPKINGPKVFGTRPGNPFIYRIPATGDRPMKFSAAGLPETLSLDANTGIIIGTTPRKRAEYQITLQAENASGRDERLFRLVAGDLLALTPPMGWNSWYIYFTTVSDTDMRDAADAMISSGMADYGYMYVNLDDCWAMKRNEKPHRDEIGNILPNEKFPDMKAMTDYIHAKGLRAGIYTSPGPWTCAGYVGSFQHEQQDAQQFAKWGFDFLKYDWCHYESCVIDHSHYEFIKPYALMGEILKFAERDTVYNLCQYGMDDVWKWGAQVDGHCWRTTHDLGNLSGYLEVGLNNAQYADYAGPGRWNDPDYILIGYVGAGPGEIVPCKFTPNQQYQYMSMWCLMAAPLFFSGDMTKLDDFTLNVLCNAEVIDIDQDPLGRQGRIVKKTEEYFIMVKELEEGSKAVGIFNTNDIGDINVNISLSDLGLTGSQCVRDVWRQKDIGTHSKPFETTIPCHGVMLFKMTSGHL